MSGPMDHDDDRMLTELFRAQRERDRARTPSFDRIVARRPSRPPVRRWAPALLLAAMLVLAVGVWRGMGPDAERPVAFQIEAGQLRTPTDFLLDLAGPALPMGVPRFGRVDDWLGLPELAEPDGQPVDESERL